jgi:preprotein translocase subunit YajC
VNPNLQAKVSRERLPSRHESWTREKMLVVFNRGSSVPGISGLLGSIAVLHNADKGRVHIASNPMGVVLFVHRDQHVYPSRAGTDDTL